MARLHDAHGLVLLEMWNLGVAFRWGVSLVVDLWHLFGGKTSRFGGGNNCRTAGKHTHQPLLPTIWG